VFTLVPFEITYLFESGFSFPLHLKKNKYQNRLNPLNDLCVAMNKCVSRYEWIISEKQQKVTSLVSNE